MRRQLFLPGPFTGTNGVALPHKVECDALTESTIDVVAAVYAERRRFSEVEGVPRGGVRIAQALRTYCSASGPRLLVDDVYTTGGSMRRHAEQLGWGDDWVGLVLFAWFLPPEHIDACWVAQSWMHENPSR